VTNTNGQTIGLLLVSAIIKFSTLAAIFRLCPQHIGGHILALIQMKFDSLKTVKTAKGILFVPFFHVTAP
jgi:hypothetical protein